eukprot:c23173_g1_i1 orf=404-832(-)
MASLTRGISFRRQGSSGMSWTDTWSFNEEGVLVRNTKEEAAAQQLHGQRFGGAALSRIHDLHLLDEEEASAALPSSSSTSSTLPVTMNCPPPSPARFSRSKSVGSLPARPEPVPLARKPVKSGNRVLRWLKKAFSKTAKVRA